MDFKDHPVNHDPKPSPQSEQAACPNCKETIEICACLRNKCGRCGEPVGNITFTVCDECWVKEFPHPSLILASKIKWRRPKRVQVWLVDDFTKEAAMIYDHLYNPVKDGLHGCLRKFVIKLVALYRKERWLFHHDPNRFPSTQHLLIKKIYE